MKQLTAALCSILILMQGLAGQTPQKPQTEIAPDEIVRITTSLVQTDVVIVDKDDHVITDIKLDEIRVSDNGKRQDVKFLEFVSPDATPRIEGNLSIAGKAVENDAARNLGAGELRRTFAFVVDDLTIPFEDIPNVRKLLTDFVDNQMREGDLVAIVRVVGGAGLLQQFTSDKRILRTAIDRITPQLTAYSAFNNLTSEEVIRQNLANITGGVLSGDNVIRSVNSINAANATLDGSNEGVTRGLRVLSTLVTASELTNSMKSLPGRKSLVLISGGLPLTETSQTQATLGSSAGAAPVSIPETRSYVSGVDYVLRQMVDRATRAGVVINTLDIRGMQATRGVSRFTDPGNEATSSLGGGGTMGQGRSPNMGMFDNLSLDTMTGRQGLQVLAQSTGGVSVINTNTFKDALDRIVARSSYYMLAYTPTEAFDNKFHKLDIKVTRPGAHVYARQGYIATADAPRANETREAAIVRAAMSPLAKRDVDLAARLQYRFLPDSRAQLDINLLVNANQITFKQDAEKNYVANFDIVGFMMNNTGKTEGGFSQTVNAKLSESDYKRALTTGISYTGHADLPPGTYQLRAVVRDGETGKLGSVSQYLEVPDLTKKHLTASSIFLFGVNMQPGSKPEPMNALRQLPRAQDLRYAVVVYNAKADAGKAQLRSQTIISRDGKIVYQEPEAPVTSALENNQVLKVGQLGLQKAHPGHYTLTIMITDPQADKQSRTIIRNVDFMLTE
jgi:VWFA-related protein